MKYTYPLYPRNGILSPIIPILVVNPSTGIKTKRIYTALVDTGADASSMPIEIPLSIGFDFSQKKRTGKLIGIGGQKPCFQCQAIFEVLDLKGKSIWSSKERTIDISESNNVPPILGYSEFLHEITLHVDYPKKLFYIEV